MELTQQQTERFNRQMMLDGFGEEGQKRLLASKVLVVGAGGLGSPVLIYLAAAGVGTLGIVDADVVSLSNLHRQVLHTTADLERAKVTSAEEKLKTLNPDVKINAYSCFLTAENAEEIIRDYDFIIDCTDNFTVKYLINDTCVRLGKPFSMGGVTGYTGQVMTHVPGTASYRDIFPEQPQASSKAILSTVPGMLGTVQATECIKYLAGVGELLTNAFLTFDALSMRWYRVDF